MSVDRVRPTQTTAANLDFLDNPDDLDSCLDAVMIDVSGGLFCEGFRNTGVAAAADNNDQAGATAGIVLSFERPASQLQPRGAATALRLELTTLNPIPTTGRIFFRDGLSSGAQGILNSVTISGPDASQPEGDPLLKNELCQFEKSALNIVFGITSVSSYVGGDANSDGRPDLGDAVWIVNELFREGPESDCPIAADCDGDGMLTLGDVSCLTGYLYFSGVPPSGPVVCTPADSPEDCPGPTACDDLP